MSFGSRGPKRITPSGAVRAPTTITRPSTSSALANSEPMIEVWATTTSPARRAKMTTKSSGRLPSVDCSTPVTRRAEALAHLLGGQRDDVGQPGERDGGEREGQQRRPSRVVRDAGERRSPRAIPAMTSRSLRRQPSHGGSEDTHDPTTLPAMLRLALARLRARGRLAVERAPAARTRRALRPRPRRARVAGDGCRIGDGCRFHVGDGAAVAIGAGARLGERCVSPPTSASRSAPGARLDDEVVLIDFDHDVADVERPVRQQRLLTAPVVIGEGAVVGTAAGVLRGVTVGDGARVGVRAVVTHDVPPGARAEGTPARVQAPASGSVRKSCGSAGGRITRCPRSPAGVPARP